MGVSRGRCVGRETYVYRGRLAATRSGFSNAGGVWGRDVRCGRLGGVGTLL